MDRWILDDAARRQREFRNEARIAAALRRGRRRVGARARVARALRAFGYVLVDAGHSLEPESWRSAS